MATNYDRSEVLIFGYVVDYRALMLTPCIELDTGDVRQRVPKQLLQDENGKRLDIHAVEDFMEKVWA